MPIRRATAAHVSEAVLNWVFGFYREEIEHGNAVRVVATPGGTGAIHASVFLGLDRGEKLIFPDLCWAPYYGMAANLGLNTATFGFSGKVLISRSASNR